MDSKKRSRKEAAKTVPTAIVKVDYETFAASNLSENESKLLCCICFKRFPFQGKIIQSCQGVENQRVKDANGDVVTSEIKGHNHCEQCHESEAFVGDKGNCQACINAGRRFQGSFQTKAITHTKSLNFSLMQINDQTHKQQKEYEDLKKSEVQEKIDVDQQARDKTRKDAAAKKREKKKQLQAFEKAVQDAQDHLDAVKGRMQEDEPQALLTYKPNAEDGETNARDEDEMLVDQADGCGDECFGSDEMIVEQALELDKAQDAMVNAKRELDAFKAAMSDEDEGDDDEDDDDAEDKDKGKNKPARKERTEEEKAKTREKVRATWVQKKDAKKREEKEIQDKLAAAEKLKTQNTTLSQSLEDVVKEKEKVQEEFQMTHASILELQVLKEAWLKKNVEAEKLQAMKAWYAPPKHLCCMMVPTFAVLLLAGCAT